MIERLAPLILLSTLTIIQAKEDVDQIPLTMVEPGGSFTLNCSVDKTEAGLVYWYKIRFGSTIQTIAFGSYENVHLQEKFNNSRFSVTKLEASEREYFLTIFEVTKEDEALYFCQAGSSYKMTFFSSTFLSVIDKENNNFFVEQTPSVSAPVGGSVKLNCSLYSINSTSVQCPSKRNVYWFRSGSKESLPNIFYTSKNQTDQDQRKCVYSLSTSVQDLSDTGTYYCAVASCGQVLFGQGTRVDITWDFQWPVCVVLGLLLLCSTVINAVMFCRYRNVTHYKGVITTSANSTELVDRSVEDLTNEDGHVRGVNYVTLDFPLRKGKRSKKKNVLPPECLYTTAWEYQ